MGRRPRVPPATPAAFQKQFKIFNQKTGKGLESPVRLGLEVKIEPKYFSVKGETFFFQLVVINHVNYFSNFFGAHYQDTSVLELSCPALVFNKPIPPLFLLSSQHSDSGREDGPLRVGPRPGQSEPGC